MRRLSWRFALRLGRPTPTTSGMRMSGWACRPARARVPSKPSTRWGSLDDLTADEALIIRFGRELLEAPQVSDETFQAVQARYGERGLLELTAVMSMYTMNANILRVMGPPD